MRYRLKRRAEKPELRSVAVLWTPSLFGWFELRSPARDGAARVVAAPQSELNKLTTEGLIGQEEDRLKRIISTSYSLFVIGAAVISSSVPSVLRFVLSRLPSLIIPHRRPVCDT